MGIKGIMKKGWEKARPRKKRLKNKKRKWRKTKGGPFGEVIKRKAKITRHERGIT